MWYVLIQTRGSILMAVHQSLSVHEESIDVSEPGPFPEGGVVHNSFFLRRYPILDYNV